MKANANGSTFGIADLAGRASIQNDVLHWVWLALCRNASPLFDKLDVPCCRERARGVFFQSARRTGEERQKVQIENPLSNDNASFARDPYDGSNGKENNQMTISSTQQTQQEALLDRTDSKAHTKRMEGTPNDPRGSNPLRQKIKRASRAILILSGGTIGALILAALGLYVATFGQYSVAATVMDDAALPQIEINGVRLHAETYGDPSNPVIIVLHGGPGGDYRSLLGAKALADTNFVVFYDQRGAGLSQRVPAEALTIPTYMAELDGVIDRYSPDRPVTLLGHSWGTLGGRCLRRPIWEKRQKKSHAQFCWNRAFSQAMRCKNGW